MVWVLIIIGILIIYNYSFKNARNDEAIKLHQKGGFRIEYEELIENFLSIPEIQIENQNATSITLAVEDKYVVTRFTITHGFNNVTVFWNHHSLEFGDHNLNWTYASNIPQNQMIKLIENDLNNYQKKLLQQYNYDEEPEQISKKSNITEDILGAIEQTADEIKLFLAKEKFNKGDSKPDCGYEIPKLLEFNTYIFAFMLELHQIKNLKESVKQAINTEELTIGFVYFMHSVLTNIKQSTIELDNLTKFSDHSRHEIWPSAYTSNIETLIEHKGILRSELETIIFQLENEYEAVKDGFKSASSNNGKYKPPYLAYLSFFIYPVMFFEPGASTVYNLSNDYNMQALYFTSPYLKLIEHIRPYLGQKNYEVLKKHGIIG